MSEKINLEVAYAKPEKQVVISLEINAGSDMETAIIQSGMLDLFPEIDLAKQKIGVFGKICALSDFPKTGDRIEIYRSLMMDPKEARRLKARAKK